MQENASKPCLPLPAVPCPMRTPDTGMEFPPRCDDQAYASLVSHHFPICLRVTTPLVQTCLTQHKPHSRAVTEASLTYRTACLVLPCPVHCRLTPLVRFPLSFLIAKIAYSRYYMSPRAHR